MFESDEQRLVNWSLVFGSSRHLSLVLPWVGSGTGSTVVGTGTGATVVGTGAGAVVGTGTVAIGTVANGTVGIGKVPHVGNEILSAPVTA